MLDKFLESEPHWRQYADLLVSPPTDAEIQDKFPDVPPSFLRKCRMIVGCHDEIIVTSGAVYWRLREEGESPRFAEMVALQAPPRCMTDREFFEGMGTLDSQFGDPLYKKLILDKAKSKGFVPGAHDVYLSSLARFPGDPEAFVPPTGGRGHIRKICEQRGWAHEGVVTVKGRNDAPNPLDSKEKRLGEDLVRENMRKHLAKNPGCNLSHGELRHTIIEKHGS